MSEIGAFDAKTHFSRLLARAAKGEAFTITHRGKPIARLVPVEGMSNEDQARAAYARMRERARSLGGAPRFDWAEWKAYRDEGRR